MPHSTEESIEIDWEDIISSNPSRVVNLIRLCYDSDIQNTWDDKPSDLYSVLDSIVAANQDNPDHWPPLVDAGLIEELCQFAINAKELPTGPEDAEADTWDCSVYYPVLDTLAYIQFPEQFTSTDRKVIDTIKTHWPSIITRCWKDPQKSLDPSPENSDERTLISDLVLNVCKADPSFLRIVDSPADMTISVIVRHYMHATDTEASSITYCLDSLFFDPPSRKMISYRERHGGTSVHIFRRLIAYDFEPPRTFLVRFASNLGRQYGSDALNSIEFLLSLSRNAKIRKDDPICASFLHAYYTSRILWASVLALLRRSAEADKLDMKGKLDGTTLFDPITELLAFAIFKGKEVEVPEISPKESSKLIKIWADCDLFGTLEIMVCHSEPIMEICRCLLGLIMGIGYVIDVNPTLASVLRSQFPRQHMSIVLEKWQYERRGDDDDVYFQGCRGALDSLVRRVREKDACSRRECLQTSAMKCSKCKAAKYCGVECQKKDWKEHKAPCQWTCKMEEIPLPLRVIMMM